MAFRPRLRTVLALLVAVCGLLPALAFAQTAPPDPVAPPGDESAGLKLAPTRYEEVIAPGQPKDGFIDVFNISKQQLTIQPEVENIRMVGTEGDLEFYIGDNPYRLHNFVELDKTRFTLGVGEARRVKFRVSFPPGVWPGGYFGSILFRIEPPDAPGAGTTVLQGGRVGTLLILTLEGDNDRRGEITKIGSTGGLVDDQRAFSVTYKNTGNTDKTPLGVAYRPVGRFTLKNMLGFKTAEEKIIGETVFPGVERKFEITKRKPLWFGRYTAEFDLAAAEGFTPERKRISFWVISPLAGGIIIVVFAGVVGGLWWRRHKRRSRVI